MGLGIQDKADEGGAGSGVFRGFGLDAAPAVSVEHEEHEGVVPVAFEELLVGVLFSEVGSFDFGSLGDPLFHGALGGMGCEEGSSLEAVGDILLFTGAGMVGQLEDVFASELMDELLAGEGVHLEVGCGGDQSADSKQLEFLGDITAEDVSMHGPEFFHLSLRDVLGAAVDEECINAGCLEFAGGLDDPRAGPDKQDALWVGGGELETSGDGAGEEAIGGDRSDDDDERERFEELGLVFEAMGEASVFDGFDDLAGEDGGDCGGDYTAGCEEAEEDALAHGEAASDGGE